MASLFHHYKQGRGIGSKLELGKTKQEKIPGLGKSNPKIPWVEVCEIRRLYETGTSARAVAEKFNRSQSTIENIVAYRVRLNK